MKKIIIATFALTFVFSCNNIKEKAKNTINKGGETVGEMATEFSEGVTEGVDRTLDSKIVISDVAKAKGIATGKFYIESDSLGKNNKLVIYIINNKDFNGTLTFKVTDKKGVEFGRQQLTLNNKAGVGGYHDVVFDPRTNIEVKSTIEIE